MFIFDIHDFICMAIFGVIGLLYGIAFLFGAIDIGIKNTKRRLFSDKDA